MFTLPDLSFSPTALEPYIDEMTMQIHHDKHHATYVKNLNEVLGDKTDADLEQILADLSDLPEEIRTKVRNNGGGHYNHSLFWQMLTPEGTELKGSLQEGIIASFGSFDKFKDEFKSKALARFGSGWVWLTNDLKIIDTPNQDNPIMEGKKVLLGLDVWEHAYYLKYQNKRADYIDAWWNIVNWEFVSSRYSSK